MHSALADVSLAKIKARIAEGDCPTIKPYSVEALEELVVHFAERAPIAPVAVSVKGNRVQGMVRSLDQWSNMSPDAVIEGSPAQVFYALTDAKHDIAALAAKLLELSSIIPATKGGEDEIGRLTHERQCLAEAIANAGKRAGIYNGEVPLTGPHLLMLADDLATAALAQDTVGVAKPEIPSENPTNR